MNNLLSIHFSGETLATLSFGLSLLLSLTTYILDRHKVNYLQTGIIFLSGLTGFLHLGIGLGGDLLLLLNGLGFIGLGVLLAVPISLLSAKRKPILWVLFFYTAITFVGYFATHTFGLYSSLALLTKAVEGILMIVIVLQVRQLNIVEQTT